MKTVGEILRAARADKNITLESISTETKINLKYLKAIEENDFNSLPAAAFTKGFLQNYATTIGVDPATVLAVFRRDYDQDERGRIIPRGLTEPVSSRINLITPHTITIGISIAVAVVIVGFFIRQAVLFNSAPKVEVYEPAENAQTNNPVSVTGRTNPEASLTVNNEPVSLDPEGNFTKQLELSQGEHMVVIVATSRSGKSRSLQRLITVNITPSPGL